MNGPDHYREAERLLTTAVSWSENRTEEDQVILAAAQVHATLALVGATVADRAIGPEETSGWHSFHADDQWREATS